MLLILACDTEENHPLFDSSKKIKELHHITWWGNNNELIKTLEVFSFNYDANGYLVECYENSYLLFKCIYVDSILTNIETGFSEGNATAIYDIEYKENRTSQVTYYSIPAFENIQRQSYLYLTNFELIRIDSFGRKGVTWNKANITKDRFIIEEHSPEGITSWHEEIEYTNIPNFFSSFQLPILPLPQLTRPLGMYIEPEILSLASFMPKRVIYNGNSSQIYSYDFRDGLVREIHIANPQDPQSEEFDVLLFWE